MRFALNIRPAYRRAVVAVSILVSFLMFFYGAEKASAVWCYPEPSGTPYEATFCPEGANEGPPPGTGSPGGPCDSSSLFGLPTWYKYLETETVSNDLTGGNTCDVRLQGIGDVWLVVAAVIEILLRVAALIAVGFIIYGGVLYIISQSQPDKTKQALKTVINALIGLVISVAAAALVSFLAGSFN